MFLFFIYMWIIDDVKFKARLLANRYLHTIRYLTPHGLIEKCMISAAMTIRNESLSLAILLLSINRCVHN